MSEDDRDASLGDLCHEAVEQGGRVVWLTGAGISVESGVPTFRGADGYWTVGSTNYRAEELATSRSLAAMPEDVWAWYLYRRGVCHGAKPNVAHQALFDLERTAPDRFLLVTQNVDGLHLRAGSSRERTFEIHGNIDFMRFGDADPVLIPEDVSLDWPKGRRFGDAERALMTNEAGELARPHVLFFDECYSERLYRFESSLQAAHECAMLVIVGTTGQTNLPVQMAESAFRQGAIVVVINAEPNPFSEAVERSGEGIFLQGTAGEHVPRVVEALKRALASQPGSEY
ncbi:MAG: RNA polymerase subunit sigma [Deltaproteobacteria bacterium]|nr:RNA polymerase subunit sigma [Deltaproteobacteria bacterium]